MSNQLTPPKIQELIGQALTACKIPANWAKILAGAIIGALTAWLSLTSSGCSSVKLTPNSATTPHGTLTWDTSLGTLNWSQSMPQSSESHIIIIEADHTK